MAESQLKKNNPFHGTAKELDAFWATHNAQWRDPGQITSFWQDASDIDPTLLKCTVKGKFWDVLAAAKITLLITREYEHLIMALNADQSQPRISYFSMPHPSGLAVDKERGVVHVASTRNPNQIFDLAPTTNVVDRLDVKVSNKAENALVPIASRFFPGCLYMHDLAIINGELYANAVGQNAIVKIGTKGSDYQRVWWPRCIETKSGPIFGQNHIQLNSIGAGDSIKKSYFSASTDTVSQRRPGHKNFPVDGKGVIFSGATREVIAGGLTRPHSARVRDGVVWVDNSGYGQVGYVEDGSFEAAFNLPGWTRGLCFSKNIAFVGTSRVIPRFRQYAPGLEVEKSICAIHALDLKTGKVLGSIIWPAGNQIFAIESLPSKLTQGFPFAVNRRLDKEKLLFYAFGTGAARTTKQV